MRYLHDCNKCKFLGSFVVPENAKTFVPEGVEVVDLYFCGNGSKGNSTVIARFGDEGSDYTSGLRLIAVNPLLLEAYNRAVREGLI